MPLKIATMADGLVVRIARDAPTSMRGAAILAVLSKPPKVADDAGTLGAFGDWCRAYWFSEQGAIRETPAIGIPADMARPIAMADFMKLWTGVDRALGAAHTLAPRLQAAEAEAELRGGPPRRRRRRTLGAEVQRTVDADDAFREQLETTTALPLPVLSTDVRTFDSRVIRPFLPVLHLAFPMAQAFEDMTRRLGQEASQDVAIEVPGRGLLPISLAGSVLRDAAFQDALLQQAERFEPLLPYLRKPAIAHPLRVRWNDETFHASGVPALPPTITSSDGVLVTLPGEHEAEGVPLVTTLLGVLAAPPEKPEDKAWQRIATAFARVWWDRMLAAQPDAATRPQWVTPSHLLFPLDQARKLVDAAERRLRERLLAGEVLGPAVQALENGSALAGRDGRKAWSLAAEIRRTLERHGRHPASHGADGGPDQGTIRPAASPKKVENVRQTVMKPSRPVIHLAIALSFMLRAMEREQGTWSTGGQAVPVPDRMRQGGWLRLTQFSRYAAHVVRLAEQLEGSTAKLPIGGPNAGGWVRLRLRSA